MKIDFLWIITVGILLLRGRICSVNASGHPIFGKYNTPAGCEAFESTDGLGVGVRCLVPAVNRSVSDLFDVLPTRFTKSLDVTCVQEHIQSSFRDTSIARINELEEIIFRHCKFTRLEKGVFTDLHHLRYLTIMSGLSEPQTLLIENYAFSELHSLEILELATNNLKAFPKDDLCNLHNLQMVNLYLNNLSNVSDLGFSGPCKDGIELCCRNLLNVYLTSNNLSVVATESFCRVPSLEILNMRGNSLQLLETKAFSNLKSLLLLDLAKNNLTSILANTWQDLNRLQRLNLSHNSICGSIDETTFWHLDSLDILDLSFNEIEVISSTTFKNLNKLTQLYLTSNRIQFIPDEAFAQLGQLSVLLLGHNDISTLSERTLFGLHNLQTFWINDNRINSTASDTFACCPSLLNVSLANNFITELPSLKVLQNLIVLDASYNALEYLPPHAFYNTKKLEMITLKHNKLKEISETQFANLTELFLINLSENQISEIHWHSFKTNSKLAYLQLTYNEIKDLITLQPNTQLIYLNLSHNSLQYLDYGLLPPSLKYLAADHNRIKSLESHLYTAKRVNITQLVLSENQIREITKTSLPPTLRTVHLDNNIISRIAEGSFEPMEKLEKVFLHANHLATMEKIVLKTKSRQRPEFYFSGNPIQCNCHTTWLKFINEATNNQPEIQYGTVQDLDYIHCWLPHMRNMKRLQLITTTNINQYMCPFTNHYFSSLICSPGEILECNITCPGECACFHDEDWKQTIVDCGGSNFSSVPTNIPNWASLLYLDGTSITKVNEESFKEMPLLTELYLNHTRLKFLGDYSFAKLNWLTVLHLEFNNLEQLPPNSFAGLQNLQKLYLQSNRLQQLHNDLFVPLKNLITLQLHNNNIVDFPAQCIQQIPLLTNLTLRQNSFSCECKYVDRHRMWLQNYSGIIKDVTKLFCYPEHNNNITISLMKFTSTYCMSAPLSSNEYLAIAISATIFATITLVCVLLFAYRHEMEVLVYSRYGFRLFHRQKEVDDELKAYDAFMSYSNEDEEFVVHELILKLEKLDVPYKLCLHQRDFAAGAFITESIIEAVERSRRTILIVTENFTKSEWCRFEFKTAHLQMMKDQCNRVIMIIVGEVPNDLDSEMKLYIKTNTFLKWGDKLFWEKLYFALPDKNKDQTVSIELKT